MSHFAKKHNSVYDLYIQKSSQIVHSLIQTTSHNSGKNWHVFIYKPFCMPYFLYTMSFHFYVRDTIYKIIHLVVPSKMFLLNIFCYFSNYLIVFRQRYVNTIHHRCSIICIKLSVVVDFYLNA